MFGLELKSLVFDNWVHVSLCFLNSALFSGIFWCFPLPCQECGIRKTVVLELINFFFPFVLCGLIYSDMVGFVFSG